MDQVIDRLMDQWMHELADGLICQLLHPLIGGSVYQWMTNQSMCRQINYF